MKKYGFVLLLCISGLAAVSQIKVTTPAHKMIIKTKRIDVLNSPYRETNLSITPDGNYLFFMTDRGGEKWSTGPRLHFKIMAYDGDIWFSQKQNHRWTTPRGVNPPINTGDGEDEPVISPDGQKVYYQSWADGWKKHGGPYYCATLEGEKWSNIVGLGDSITLFFKNMEAKYGELATDGMTLSPDGNSFFVAFGTSYEKPMDIYFSKQSRGKWSYPVRHPLSSDGDERSLFMAADGKTLYFASSGYGGFGNLDIFKATLQPNHQVAEVVNLGRSVNTKNDDYGFIIEASGNMAYYVSNGDIFSADLSEAGSIIKPMPTKVISGTITDKLNRPIAARVSLTNIETRRVVATVQANSITGRYSLLSDETDGSYHLTFTTPAGGNHSQKLTLNNEQIFENLGLSFVFNDEKLHLLTQSKTIVVYFDVNSHQLSESFMKTLSSQLNDEMKTYIVNMVASGFTDSDGNLSSNQALSLKRAQAVATFLATFLNQPVETESFGEANPAATNASDEGKSFNRRVEVVVNYQIPQRN